MRRGRQAHWCGDRKQSTLWEVPNLNPFGSGEAGEIATGHGTQKPVELMRRPMLHHTERGAIIYDPFLDSGSTLAAAEELGRICYGLEIDAASGRERLVWYVGPTYKKAKRIAWSRLKQLKRPLLGLAPERDRADCHARLGRRIALCGADQYDRLRGDGLDFVVLDEYASMRPACWTEVIRPALSDRAGGALFIGTPQAFNHFYERYEDEGTWVHSWRVFLSSNIAQT